MSIDTYSFLPLRIEPQFGDTSQGVVATAFAYQHTNGSLHLITNWHNVTGRDAETGENVSPRTAMWPDRLIVALHGSSADQMIEPVVLPLLGENDTPLWLVHPRFGKRVDVVAVPFTATRPQGVLLRPINLQPNVDMGTGEGDDVFVLGYPDGLTGGLRFPLWKRGTIASPPSLDYGGLPLMVIDATTGKGMSGSPVIQRPSQNLPPILVPQGTVPSSQTNRPTKFIGIYSGRLGETGMKSQLGRVWRAEVIEQIVNAGCRDERGERWMA